MPTSSSAGLAVLTIVAPGFADALAREPQRLPSLEKLAGYADGIETPHSHGALEAWQSELLDALALDLDQYPSAPVTWLGATGQRVTGAWLHADPVFLAPSAQGLELQPAPPWTREQLNSATSLVSEHLAAHGMTWHALGERSFIQVSNVLDTRTESVRAAARMSLTEAMPTGVDAKRLRQAMNDVQMLLHDKLGYGTLDVRAPNGVWLWGAGRLPDAADRRLPAMWCDDDFARGVYRLHGASDRCFALPDTLDEVLRADDAKRVVLVRDKHPAALESAWFAPALRALDAGRVREVIVCLDGSRINARRSFLKRLFARPRALQAAPQ